MDGGFVVVEDSEKSEVTEFVINSSSGLAMAKGFSTTSIFFSALSLNSCWFCSLSVIY